MLQKLIRTECDLSALVLRVTLGVVFFPHGAQKLLGWYGGNGFSGTMEAFTTQIGIPWIFAFLAIVAEFFGALGLMTGLLTRVAASGIFCVMAVALTMHWPNGFFMNWYGTQEGEGIEFHLLAMAIAVALMIKGGGLWSADRALARRLESGQGSRPEAPTNRTAGPA